MKPRSWPGLRRLYSTRASSAARAAIVMTPTEITACKHTRGGDLNAKETASGISQLAACAATGQRHQGYNHSHGAGGGSPRELGTAQRDVALRDPGRKACEREDVWVPARPGGQCGSSRFNGDTCSGSSITKKCHVHYV